MDETKNNSTNSNIEINEMNNDNARLVELAKEKLRWYTLEASDEEFDVEAVDALVNLINTFEPQTKQQEESAEEALQRFRAYCDMRMREKKTDKAEFSCKITRFSGKKWAGVVAAACLMVIILAGGTLGIASARQGSGFFHWLRKDEKGLTVITSPSKGGEGIQAGEGIVAEYDNLEKIPSYYQQYVIEKESIASLQDYEFLSCAINESPVLKRFDESFICQETQKIVALGVLIYPEDVVITKESYTDYELIDVQEVKGWQQDIFSKDDINGEKEYCVIFYKDNKRYFVNGKEDIVLLKEMAEEYMDSVLKQK